jgi:hypothetical protein
MPPAPCRCSMWDWSLNSDVIPYTHIPHVSAKKPGKLKHHLWWSWDQNPGLLILSTHLTMSPATPGVTEQANSTNSTHPLLAYQSHHKAFWTLWLWASSKANLTHSPISIWFTIHIPASGRHNHMLPGPIAHLLVPHPCPSCLSSSEVQAAGIHLLLYITGI